MHEIDMFKTEKTHKEGEGATKRAKTSQLASRIVSRFAGIKVILRKDSLRRVDVRYSEKGNDHCFHKNNCFAIMLEAS